MGEASNVEDFARQLATLDLEVVRHHVSCGDFSRWLADVLQDHELALTIRTAERSHGAATSDAVRATILAAVRRRYLDTEPRRMMTVALSQ